MSEEWKNRDNETTQQHNDNQQVNIINLKIGQHEDEPQPDDTQPAAVNISNYGNEKHGYSRHNNNKHKRYVTIAEANNNIDHVAQRLNMKCQYGNDKGSSRMPDIDGGKYNDIVDVLIIGAGWSGLVCGHNCLKQGLSILIIEKRSDIGGIFTYTDNPCIPSVNETTEFNSSKMVTEISDFPYNKSGINMGEFPSHWNVYKYLHSFAKKYALLEKIIFNTSVIDICKNFETKVWNIKLSSNNCKIIKSTNIACCIGLNGIKQPIPKIIRQNFKGKILDGCEIKKLLPIQNLVKNKNLLLIGGGETASDLMLHLHPFAKKSYWSIRNGAQFFRKRGKYFGNFLNNNNLLLSYDTVFTPILSDLSPMTKCKPGLQYACKWSATGDIFGYDGHGIDLWKNPQQYLASAVNKSGEILKYVKMGYIIPTGEIINCADNIITFCDKTIIKDIDIVIFCCGFKPHINFFNNIAKDDHDEKYYYDDPAKAYLNVINIFDNTLAYIGYVRPTIGSIVLYSELNSRWISLIWSKKIILPSFDKLCELYNHDMNQKQKYFGEIYLKRYPYIVDPEHYKTLIKKLNLIKIINEKLNVFEKLYYYLFITMQTVWLNVLDFNDDEIKNNNDLRNKIPNITETGLNIDIFEYCILISWVSMLRLIKFETFWCYYIQEIRCFLQKNIKIVGKMEMKLYKIQNFLCNHKLYPFDNNIYLTYNPCINQEIIKYYNAIVLHPNNQKNSIERVRYLEFGVKKWIVTIVLILSYLFMYRRQI